MESMEEVGRKWYVGKEALARWDIVNPMGLRERDVFDMFDVLGLINCYVRVVACCVRMVLNSLSHLIFYILDYLSVFPGYSSISNESRTYSKSTITYSSSSL